MHEAELTNIRRCPRQRQRRPGHPQGGLREAAATMSAPISASLCRLSGSLAKAVIEWPRVALTHPIESSNSC